MMRPMPFWPSFEPCAKLTPVQVRISSPRIQKRRRRRPFGLVIELRRCGSAACSDQQQQAADTKPTSGDNSSD